MDRENSSDIRIDSDEEWEQTEWVATDTLVSANRRVSHVLEQYLLQQYYRNEEPNYEELQTQLDVAIEEHERLVEDLRAARLAIEMMK